MGVLAFIAELVKALAWPGAILIALLVFRRYLARAVERLTTLRWRDWSIEFNERAEAVAERLGQSDERALTRSSDTEELLALAERSPRLAIIEAATRVETELRRLASNSIVDAERKSPAMLIQLLEKQGTLDRATIDSLRGFFIMRNLAVHASENDVTAQKATDFVTLANAILFVLSTKH